MKGIDSEGRLTFGKYIGKLLTNIIKLFPDYVKWAIKAGKLQLPNNLKQ